MLSMSNAHHFFSFGRIVCRFNAWIGGAKEDRRSYHNKCSSRSIGHPISLARRDTHTHIQYTCGPEKMLLT